MSPRGRAVLLAFALVAPGCFLFKPPPKPAPCEVASTKREVFLGLYSIFYRVTAAVSGVDPPGWAPAPLAEAKRWLQCDPDDSRRPGRIRYAVVKLAAGIVAVGKLSPDVQELERALHDLIGKTTLLKQLARWGAFDLPTLEDIAGAIIDEADEPALAALHRTCCPCIEECVAGPSTGESITEFRIKVNRNPPCLFHAVDPQCWPSAVPLYAAETFILSNAMPCAGGAPVCRTTHPCVLGDSPISHPTPPSAGKPWCGLVYEDVKAESNGVTANFRNILKVDMSSIPPSATPATATGIKMQYGLCESISWQMCDPTAQGPSCQSGDCPITRDCGFAWVDGTGVPGWAVVDGTKRIRFKAGLPHDANLWAPIALEVLVKETALAACSEAAMCPRAATPTGCTGLAGKDECTCPRDHCVQQPFVAPLKESLFCP